MISVEDAVICRLKKGGNVFEVLVDPDKALNYKKGEELVMDDVLAVQNIFRDARKGDVVSETELEENFGTTNITEVIKNIIRDGDLQFTTEQRRRFIKEKTNKIADIISKRSINPQTNTPHPMSRILNAMEKVGVHVDPFQEAESQVDDVVESIRTLLPIKFQRVVFQIVIPPKHAGKVYSVLKRLVKKFEESWLNDGSLQVMLEVPAGIQMNIIKQVGDVTHGDFKSEILKRVDV